MFGIQKERFCDRREGGRELARLLTEYKGREDVVVLALPRGGVPVGYEIARNLGVAMDVFIVRKLGVPGHEELAMGAIATGNVRVLNEDVIRRLKISPAEIDAVAGEQGRELLRREREYRGDKQAANLEGKVCILVDDGLATGASMRAGVQALKGLAPAKIVVAVPVGAPETCGEFAREVARVVCPRQPDDFRAVGVWYQDFGQTTDEEVRQLLQEAERDYEESRTIVTSHTSCQESAIADGRSRA